MSDFKEAAMPLPTATQVSGIRRVLSQLVATEKVSADGIKWLTVACDPWHDTPVEGVRGMPDQQTGKSVTFQVTQEYQISKPAGLAAGNWSCRISNNPFETRADFNRGGIKGQIVHQDLAQLRTVAGAVDIAFCNDAAPDNGLFRLLDDNVLAPMGAIITLPTAFTIGTTKVIGKGIEVINTTAEIYQQGLCSSCRYNQPDNMEFAGYLSLGFPANAWTFCSQYPVIDPPASLAQLVEYPNNAQWHAKEGYYAPVVLKTDRMVSMPLPVYPVRISQDLRSGVPTDLVPADSIVCSATTVPGSVVTFFVPSNQPLQAAQDGVCSIFSGLNDNTTLTVRVRWIIEQFPDITQEQILSISTPTSDYDPMALEIYSRVCQHYPAAVMYKENPAGEWFKRVLGQLGEVVGPMIAMLPHPAAKIAGTAISTFAPMLTESADKSKRKRKKKKAAVNNNLQVRPKPRVGPKPLPPIPNRRQ